MSVYNASRYISESVESILHQTLSNFEFLIIDDSSTDNTVEILNRYDDPRICLIQNKKNIGLTKSLNKGLAIAQGKYIARMDADDISLPERLQRQKSFLDTYPGIAMVGSWVEVINQNNEKIKYYNHPTKSHLIRWHLLFANAFTHSSIMIRTERLKSINGYSDELKYAQDFDLYSRLSDSWHVANIPEILVQWRNWEKGISVSQNKLQHKTAHQIARKNIEQILGETIDDKAFDKLFLLYHLDSGGSVTFSNLAMIITNLQKLAENFIHKFKLVDKNISSDLTVEIATHIFSMIIYSNNGLLYKMHMFLYSMKKLNPNFFRIFWIYITQRTYIGSRLLKFKPF